MKVSDAFKKFKKSEPQAFQPELKPYKNRRLFSIFITVFVLLSCLVAWMPPSQKIPDVIKENEHAFVQAYLINKMSSDVEGQKWATTYEIQGIETIKYEPKLNVAIQNIQILSGKATETGNHLFEVGFIMTITDELKNVLLRDYQYGEIETHEIVEDQYIVVKGFQYKEYIYKESSKEEIAELEQKIYENNLKTEGADAKEKKEIEEKVAFFYERYNTNVEQARLLVDKEFYLVDKGSGIYQKPVVETVGLYMKDYYATVSVEYVLPGTLGTLKHRYTFIIDGTTQKIKKIESI